MANARAKYEITAEDKTKNAIRGIRKNFQGMNLDVMAVKSAIVGLAGTAGLGYLIKSSIDAADEVGKLSQRLGASTEALSQYRHVADLTGVSFNTLTMGWQRMTRRVAEAAQGTGEARNALIELNLSAQDLSRLAPEQQFEVIAQALSGVETQADKVRLAMKLFDSEGVSLLQTMTDGAAGLRDMRAEADALGLTLSAEDSLGAAAANDAIARLKASFQGLSMTAARELGPVIAEVANWFSVHLPAAVQFSSDAFKAFRHFAIEIVQQVVNGLAEFYSVLAKLPFGLGETYARAEENMRGFSAHLEETQERLALATGTLKEFKTTSQSIGGTGIAAVGAAGESEAERKKAEVTRNRLQANLDAVSEFLMSEEEALFNSYANRQLIVENAFETGMISEVRHQELLLKLTEDYEAKRTQIIIDNYTERQKFAAMSSKEQTKSVLGEAIALTQGVAGQSKALFQINKAAAIGNAIINTYEGVTKSLSAYPWPLAGAMAALHLASGLAQVQAIKSQSFGGGGGAPSVAASGGTPSNPVPQSVPTSPQGQQQGGNITIRIEGNVYSNDDFRSALVDALKEAQQNDEIRVINAN